MKRKILGVAVALAATVACSQSNAGVVVTLQQYYTAGQAYTSLTLSGSLNVLGVTPSGPFDAPLNSVLRPSVSGPTPPAPRRLVLADAGTSELLAYTGGAPNLSLGTGAPINLTTYTGDLFVLTDSWVGLASDYTGGALSGSATLVGGLSALGIDQKTTTWSFNGDTVTFTAIPEPETYAGIAAVGLVGFGLWRRASRRG